MFSPSWIFICYSMECSFSSFILKMACDSQIGYINKISYTLNAICKELILLPSDILLSYRAIFTS